MQKRIRQQVTLSDSFTSSLLSYPNMPLTAVQICYHRTYNRVMVCVCLYGFASVPRQASVLKAFGRSFQASLPCLPSRYINRLHYRKPCEQPAKRLKSFLPLTDFVLYSITQNQISLSVKIAFVKKPPQKRWLKKLFT